MPTLLFRALLLTVAALALSPRPSRAFEPVPVEGQPLAANAVRVAQALEALGTPLPARTRAALAKAAAANDAAGVQAALDPHALLLVTINPEQRVKVARGPARAVLQQGAYTPVV